MPDEIDLTPDDEALLQEIWQELATRRTQTRPAETATPPDSEQTHDVG